MKPIPGKWQFVNRYYPLVKTMTFYFKIKPRHLNPKTALIFSFFVKYDDVIILLQILSNRVIILNKI